MQEGSKRGGMLRNTDDVVLVTEGGVSGGEKGERLFLYVYVRMGEGHDIANSEM